MAIVYNPNNSKGLFFDRPGKSGGLSVFESNAPQQLSDEELQTAINTLRLREGQTGIDLGVSKNFINVRGILEEELNKRASLANQEKQKSELERILGGGGAGGDSGISSDDFRMRQALEDIFNTGRTSGENAINESFAADRGRAIDEAGASGLLRTPGFLTKTLADIDARKSNAVRDLMLGLEGERARGKLGLEDTLFNRGETALNNKRSFNLARAGLNQGGNQFQQTFGLQRDQFGEAKRRASIDDIFTNRSLDEAERVGRAEADARKPTFLDQFAQITGGIGNLASGIGSLTRPRARAEGAY